jgi:hypothetical protein
MADYQLTATDDVVIRTSDGASIPNSPDNRDWVEYQEWLYAGNTPDPYVPPPEPKPELSVTPETELLYEHENRLLELEGKPPTNIRDFVKKMKKE